MLRNITNNDEIFTMIIKAMRKSDKKSNKVNGADDMACGGKKGKGKGGKKK